MISELTRLKRLQTRKILVALLLLGIGTISFYNYLLFHTIAELYTIITFFCITILASNAYALSPKNIDSFYKFLGIASFFIAIIHILHALAYKGMGVFSDSTANLPTQLYIISRYMLSLSLLAASYFCNKKVKESYVALAYVIITSFLLLSVFYWRIFPDCYLEDYGLTTFKITSEYIICTIFVITVVYLYLNRQNFHPEVLKHIFYAIAFAVAGELLFTLYIGVYDYFNMLGHLIHVLSTIYLYRGLVKRSLEDPIRAIFSELSEKNEELETQTLELQRINEMMEQEIEEKNRIQRELTTSRNLYQGIFHNLMEGFAYNKIIFDEEGNAVDYVFLEVNDAFANFYGWKRNEILGKRATELFPKAAKLWLPLFERIVKEGNSVRLKHHFVEENKWITISAFSPEENYFATIITDVTDLKSSWEKKMA